VWTAPLSRPDLGLQAGLDVAVEFTREVLKAIYQYAALLQKIRSLKAT